MARQARRIPMAMLPADEAVLSFAEAAVGYSGDEAAQEAQRAGDADLADARLACPFQVDIKALVQAVAAGDFVAAQGVVLQAHPWPGILGRHCSRPCERAHSLGEGIEPLFISAIERAAADHGNRAQFPFKAGPPSGRRVAVIGAGSAASAAAYRLRQLGHAVDMFEQLPVAGGMMFAGYPEFRLPVATLREENSPEDWGCAVHYDTTLTRDLLGSLLKRFDAVVLGTGKFKEVRMGIPGEALDGVWDGLRFLTEVKLGRSPALGRRVVVLGAGYTAQDVSRTCRRLGSEVTILYRRTKDEMPVEPFLRDRHVARQAAEGAPYLFETTAIRILGRGGKVTGLECVRTSPGVPDQSGRPEALPVPGSNYVVPCDTVIEATGETVDLSFLPDEVNIVDGRHVGVDGETWMTAVPGLFACGEMTGTDGTVKAFASGFKAAAGVDRFVRAEALAAPITSDLAKGLNR